MDPNGNVIHMSASRKQKTAGARFPDTTSHLSTQSILDEVKKAHNSDVNSIDRNRAIFHSLSTEAKKKGKYMHRFHQPRSDEKVDRPKVETTQEGERSKGNGSHSVV